MFADHEVKATWQAADQLNIEQGAFIKLMILLAPRKRGTRGDALVTPRRSQQSDDHPQSDFTATYRAL